MSNYRTHEEILLERLKDRANARMYINIAFEEYAEDNDMYALVDSVYLVAKAAGAAIPDSILDYLKDSSTAPAPHSALVAVLKTLGYRLSVVELESDLPTARATG